MRAPSPRRPSGGAERYDGAVITAGVRVVLGSDDSMYKPCGLNFSLISLYYKSAPRAKRRQKRVSEVSRARLRLRQKRRRSADTIPQNPPGEGWSVAKPSATSPQHGLRLRRKANVGVGLVRRSAVPRWRDRHAFRNKQPELILHVIPSAHTTHAAAHSRLVVFLLRHFGHHRFSRDEHGGDRRRVLKRGTGNLRGINHACLHQIFVLVGRGIVAKWPLMLLHFFHDHGSVLAGIQSNLPQGLFQCAPENVHADLLLPHGLHRIERG